MECRQRTSEDPIIESKRPNYSWYFKLESESSCASQEDTESVCSLQNQETDIARDTTDTDSKPDCSDTDLEVELEYDIATTSEDDNLLEDSSGTDDALATAGAIAAAICDSSLEAWATDAEDSDSSSMDDNSFGRTDFWTCVQCKSQNNNPLFRYCEQCYQIRKTLFPPRPRRHKRLKKGITKPAPAVKLESLRSCLSGLSQDSGIGSSQEFPALQLDKIIVPKHLTEATSSTASRKRQCSESSLSDFDEVKRFKPNGTTQNTEKLEMKKELCEQKEKVCNVAEKFHKQNGIEYSSKLRTFDTVSEGETLDSESVDSKELCIICNHSPKNSIFLHGNIAHRCCCYKCAIKTWGLNKRCPACNCRVKNVVKVFTI